MLQELYVNLRRKAARPVDLKSAREIVTDYLTWKVHVNAGESILAALEIEQRYRISFWDALVIQAAEASGASVIYSEYLSDGQVYGSVRIVNPLTKKPQHWDRVWSRTSGNCASLRQFELGISRYFGRQRRNGIGFQPRLPGASHRA